jgi:hypothetical protein
LEQKLLLVDLKVEKMEHGNGGLASFASFVIVCVRQAGRCFVLV